MHHSMRPFKLTCIILLLATMPLLAQPSDNASPKNAALKIEDGAQRLTKAQIQKWEALGYGIFIHFGMSTYDGIEMSPGALPATAFNPTKLDVEQWIRTAAEAGMKYAVLTTKHVSGFCLWPTKYNDYHVMNSSVKVDIVGEFVKQCRKYGLMPGLYYCSWDNKNLFGSKTPPAHTGFGTAFTTEEYRKFQWNQLEELCTQYGAIGEVWIDIPSFLPRDYRDKLYAQIVKWQPEAVITFNNGHGDGTTMKQQSTWPTDLLEMERQLPDGSFMSKKSKYEPWKTVDGKKYYLPGEMNLPIGNEWFFVEGDLPKSDEELLGMYLINRSRGANFLLNVPPNQEGLLPDMYVKALMRLKENLIKLNIK
ncbi:alpha-L-fucosidase [Dyadobacter jejuensis]|uniref:alpha-L-fucosidase n=2 Tax=Dyadobacter jejuensis TaxID=1082580 RepID=A0A316AK12_9BACT|nr:alpha-L-fucosidase [Dyadobacter jejuensis]